MSIHFQFFAICYASKNKIKCENWINVNEDLMTIIFDGEGGCGKTTLDVDVLFPLMET